MEKFKRFIKVFIGAGALSAALTFISTMIFHWLRPEYQMSYVLGCSLGVAIGCGGTEAVLAVLDFKTTQSDPEQPYHEAAYKPGSTA
jgi:hypothetical protein